MEIGRTAYGKKTRQLLARWRSVGVAWQSTAGIPTAHSVDHVAFSVPDLEQVVSNTGVLGGGLHYEASHAQQPLRLVYKQRCMEGLAVV